MFLQPSGIVEAARATIGDRVSTSLGSGVVRCYSSASDTYTIDLGTLYAICDGVHLVMMRICLFSRRFD